MEASMIHDLLHNLKAYPNNTGLVVGIVNNGQSSVFDFGRVGQKSDPSHPGNVLFEIGSVSKVFTTALLSVAIADGTLNLDDPVKEHMPQLSHWPSNLSILHLATHTSGLPKMPSNLFSSMMRDRKNPYKHYTTIDLLEYLTRFKSKGQLPARVNYSNTGIALLGIIVGNSLGTSYEKALVERICNPLSLSDTRIEMTPDQQKRLAAPHVSSGKPGHTWNLPAFVGAGGLHSTADDLLRFLKVNLGESHIPLSETLEVCHPVRTSDFSPPGLLQRSMLALSRSGSDQSDYRQSMALAWTVGRLRSIGKQFHWHHGATGGYRAFIGFAKSTGTGVVVLANSGLGMLDALRNTTATDILGFEILEYLNS